MADLKRKRALGIVRERGHTTVTRRRKWGDFTLFWAVHENEDAELHYMGIPAFILVDTSNEARYATRDEVYMIMGWGGHEGGIENPPPIPEPKIVKIPPEELARIDSRAIFESMNWKAPDPNDPDLEPCQILCYLALGSRKPQNEMERGWLEDIRAIEAAGGIVEIPFD